MDQEQLRGALETLDALTRTEDLMALYYTACSEAWPEHSALWMDLAVEEENHGRIVIRLREILEANPALFEPGRPLELNAVESCNLGISEMAHEIRRGSVPLSAALRFAEGMEAFLIESDFLAMLQSSSPAYEELRAVVTRETSAHHERIGQVFRQIAGDR